MERFCGWWTPPPLANSLLEIRGYAFSGLFGPEIHRSLRSK
jgi:hypothetical protein